MRCEFLLILYPICWLHLSPLVHPKVLRRLRNEWCGTGSGRGGACARRASAGEREGEREEKKEEALQEGKEKRRNLVKRDGSGWG